MLPAESSDRLCYLHAAVHRARSRSLTGGGSLRPNRMEDIGVFKGSAAEVSESRTCWSAMPPTRARVTQIMNLLQLAPDIQEEILSLPRTTQGRDPIRERMLRPIAAVLDWRKQRRMWQEVRSAM